MASALDFRNRVMLGSISKESLDEEGNIVAKLDEPCTNVINLDWTKSSNCKEVIFTNVIVKLIRGC